MNADILLLRGNKKAGCQVVCQKQDTNGKLIGRSNQYQIILETNVYEVEFSGEEMTELAGNINA